MIRGRAALLLPLLAVSLQARVYADGLYRFVDHHEAAGVNMVVWCGRPDKPHLLESGGSGAALFDYDADADLDLYVVNGWRLDGSEVIERGANRLYRNRGDGTFEDVTNEAGVGDAGWGTAITVGDIDGDMDLDLFVSNFGPDLLYRNEGDGTFSRETESPGIDGWSSSAVFLDADGDGDQDLFVTGYVNATLEDVLAAKPRLLWKERNVMEGPFGLEGLANRYFRNDGQGRFSEDTAASGLSDVGLFYSLGVVATDFNNDGRDDLYVANDSNPNYLFENRGGGKFREVGLWSGAALDHNGNAQAGMGIAAADYDSDGLTDLFVTHFSDDASTLYQNTGDMTFKDVSLRTGIRNATFAPLSWGTVFADFDLDGDLELFVANGHIYPQADSPPSTGTRFRQRNQLLEQRSNAFVDVSSEAGEGLRVVESSRGVAKGDIDGDGDVDLVVVNVDAPVTLLRNESNRKGNWLLIDAPGAIRVDLIAGDRRWRQNHVAGGSYASFSDPRFHFGVGPATRVDSIRVLWPRGVERTLNDIEVNRSIRVDRP